MGFDRVELGRIGRQILDDHPPSLLPQLFPYPPTTLAGKAIPDDQQVAHDMAGVVLQGIDPLDVPGAPGYGRN